jgi:hypothetical protein
MKSIGSGAIPGEVSYPVGCAKAFALLPAASFLAAWSAGRDPRQLVGVSGHGKFEVL